MGEVGAAEAEALVEAFVVARVDLLIPGRTDAAIRLTIPSREVFATRLGDKMTSSKALLIVAEV